MWLKIRHRLLNVEYIHQIKMLCNVSWWQVIINWQRNSKWSFQTEPGLSLLSSYILQHSSLASPVPVTFTLLFVSLLALSVVLPIRIQTSLRLFDFQQLFLDPTFHFNHDSIFIFYFTSVKSFLFNHHFHFLTRHLCA